MIGADAAEVAAGRTTRRAIVQGPRDVMQNVVFPFGSQPAMTVVSTAVGVQVRSKEAAVGLG